MAEGSSDLQALNQYLESGHLVAEPVHELASLDPRTIDRFTSFFSIATDARTLLDPANSDKHLVVLGHPTTGDRVELVISDDAAKQRVEDQLGHQRGRVGTLIRARCVVIDNSLAERPANHGVDRLVESLDGTWGWRFSVSKRWESSFQVEVKLESSSADDIKAAKRKLRVFLDWLAVSYRIGFHVQQVFVGPIRRSSLNPYVLDAGPEERLLDAVGTEAIANIEAMVSTAAAVAARGLNEAYSENFAPSKLARLWAATEDIFSARLGAKPEHLLLEAEQQSLLDGAKRLETLANDERRMQELTQVLTNPERLPLVTRNRRMAAALAPILGVDDEEVYKKVRKASELRGTQVHKILDEWDELRDSIQFLQQALHRYLEQEGVLRATDILGDQP